jgi:hypothetical protein
MQPWKAKLQCSVDSKQTSRAVERLELCSSAMWRNKFYLRSNRIGTPSHSECWKEYMTAQRDAPALQ